MLKLCNSSRKTTESLNNVTRETFLKTIVSYSTKKLNDLKLITVKPPLVFGRRSRKLGLKNRSFAHKKVDSGKGMVRKRDDLAKKAAPKLCEKLFNFFSEKVVKNWPNTGKNSKVTKIKEYGGFRKIYVIGLSGVKFCKNVNREHSNNNIYFCVSLENGCYYQKCHSQLCIGYRSNPIPWC